jgi:hypothetical protein
VRLVVDDEHGDEALTVPRAAVALLAHMASSRTIRCSGVSSSQGAVSALPAC